MFRLNRDVRPQLWREARGRRDPWRKKMTAVDERRIRVEQLHRCHPHVVARANRVLRVPVRAPHRARRLATVHSAWLAKTKFVQRFVKVRLSEALADLAEIVVTRIGERVGRIERRQIARMRTDGVKIFVRIFFVADGARVFVDHIGAQRGQRRERFYG